MDSIALPATQWLSLYWFRWSVLSNFSYENAYVLWAIPVIPVFYFIKWVLHYRFREKVEIAFMGKKEPYDLSALLRFIPPGVQSFFFIFLLLALARPQKTSEIKEQKSEGIDIVLALDISESMRMEDLRPNRLEAAKNVGLKFIQGRLNDRIGIVLFAGEAFSLSPLTNDYGLLEDYLDQIDFNLISKPGTAIGSALAVATNRMLESKSKSKIVVLISDGDNTAGNIDPFTAAEIANAYGVKLYTIAVGKDGPVPMGEDIFGNTNYVQNNLDEATLRKIAALGQGQFFRATNNTTLQRIFKKIDQFERTEIKVKRFKQKQDYYTIYLSWAVVLLLLWLALKSTFLMNALED